MVIVDVTADANGLDAQDQEMPAHRAYRHRLVLTPQQEGVCRRTAGCCRFVYNCGREQRMLGYGVTGRGIHYGVQSSSQLKEAKDADGFEFLKEAPAQCLQQALKDLDDAYQRFFSGQNRYPQPRRRGMNDSFRFPQPEQIRVHEPACHNQVRLPKLGWVTVRNSYLRLANGDGGPRLFEGELKSVTVSREGTGTGMGASAARSRPSRSNVS